jgi:hypothetical protein
MRWERVLIVGSLLSASVAGATLSTSLAGCSSPAPVPPTLPAASTDAAAPASKNDIRSRLQGTWELVTFISFGPIPDEAMPILALLHGAVRLRFEGENVTTFIPGNPDEESCVFEVADENGDAFTLVTSQGMFHRAQARFLADGSWEATERGPTWPGTTGFRRVAK